MAILLPAAGAASTFLDDFTCDLEDHGVQAILAVLNAGVSHRYTTLYRIDGSRLRSLCFHDRAGRARPPELAAVDMRQSYCQFALRDGIFLTDNALFDQRLDDHPCQGVMVSYHGVSVIGPGGAPIGTLFHFDTVPRGLMAAQFQMLREAARWLAPWVARQGAA